MNTGLLNRNSFQTEMIGELKLYLEFNDNGEVNPVILWDAAKAFLSGKIIALSAKMKKVKAKRLSDLQEKLKNLERTQSINKDSSTLEQMRPVKQEIDKILSEEIEKKLKI